MVRAVSALVLLCGLVLLGGACSGKTLTEGDDDDDDPVSPTQKCHTYASTWCNKAFGCYVKVGRMKESERQGNVDKCVKIIVDRLPCSEVSSVIDGMSCARWDVPTTQFGTVTPPTSCDTALSF
jgi:hypothetical protein